MSRVYRHGHPLAHLQTGTGMIGIEIDPVEPGRKIDMENDFPYLVPGSQEFVGGSACCDHDFPANLVHRSPDVYEFHCCRCQGVMLVQVSLSAPCDHLRREGVLGQITGGQI